MKSSEVFWNCETVMATVHRAARRYECRILVESFYQFAVVSDDTLICDDQPHLSVLS